MCGSAVRISRVDGDAAARPERQARRLREPGLRAHADREDDEIGGEPRAGLGHRDDLARRSPTRSARARRRDGA